MKKIALLTPFDTGNIGTVLQAFATQSLFQEQNASVEIVYFHYNSIQNPFLISNLFKRGFKKYIGSIAGYFLRLPGKKGLWNFIERHLVLTKKMSRNDLKELESKYDLIAVGSDCVWNGEAFSLESSYLLDFVEDNSKKINYASSFACDDIPESQKHIFRDNLCKFDSLSVRELRGKEIIKELTGKDATVVLDPTLARNKYFWSKIADESKLKINQDFIFVAEYAISPALLNDAEKMSLKYNLPIYCLYPPKGKKIKSKVLFNAAPEDVCYLLLNAKMVLTDSYHMMIFSINFGKEFFAYRTNTNMPAISKYYSILEILNINNRLFNTENSAVNSIDILSCEPINYNMVNTLLEEERAKSLEYIDKILS